MFMSRRIVLRRPQCHRIVVLCPQHKYHIRHGLWSRSAALCGNLAYGSMLNYIYTATTLNVHGKRSLWSDKHFDYVIAEPNCFVMCSAVDESCPDGSFPVIPSRNNSAAAHFEWLWDRYLVRKSEAKIFWIGHMEGCHDIKHLLSVRPEAASRTAGIVFMDYCIDSMAEIDGLSSMRMVESASSPLIGATVDPVVNPHYKRFFSGKAENWLVQPIVVSTEKYPMNSAYDWSKEARGDITNRQQLASAPVVLLYSVNTNWRFTPSLSMFIVNKYLLTRGMIDDEYLWKTPKERYDRLQQLRNGPDRDLRDLRRASMTKSHHSNISTFVGFRLNPERDLNGGLLIGDGLDDLNDIDRVQEQPVFDSIPDHLLPAAHDQGPLSMNNRNGNRTQKMFSLPPPTLITAESVRERRKRQMERERVMEQQRARELELAMIRAMEEEAAKLKGGGGKKKKKKKKKKGKDGDDEDDEEEGGGKKKGKKKKDKKDKKEKKEKKEKKKGKKKDKKKKKKN